jgi:hypothetical protein
VIVSVKIPACHGWNHTACQKSNEYSITE